MAELTADDGRTRTSEHLNADDADLQAGIGNLAGLVPVLSGCLSCWLRWPRSRWCVPGADGAGVTLLRFDRPDNMVAALAASAPFVAEIDEIQYMTLHEGPCITAALERRTVRSGSSGGERCGRGSVRAWAG